jgi:hypothetical protein
MTDVIAQYQKWKEQGESLRAQAKEAMESRFRELLSEAVQIAEEYRRDFGGTLKPAMPVTAFRYKASAKVRARKTGKKPKQPEPEQPAARSDPKLARLQKRLATVKTKVEAAKAAGKPTRNLEDKVYEIEDEIRLTAQPSG